MEQQSILKNNSEANQKHIHKNANKLILARTVFNGIRHNFVELSQVFDIV